MSSKKESNHFIFLMDVTNKYKGCKITERSEIPPEGLAFKITKGDGMRVS